MTHRRLVKLDDFVKEPTTYNRFGEKVTKTPIERIANGGLLSNYKQLSTNAKYIKFTGMLEPNDGGEGMYIQDDTITNDEDIGVIIYIGEHKYRRLYAAWVNIDWFYLGDFGQALQRACNYNSIRGTAGKTYECKTEITLKINISSVGNHGMVDYGHKLIDMRGATVNFTNEEALYCFNIRIYHRDTKFMFTNCNFNVTDNNIGLVNIANIIGVNNYTDMLTGNVYNVSKDKLPNTNSVVLTDEPEIEGIKTFDGAGQVTYVGEALSANDNQAVTKEYKPADYDETAYVSLKDTRKLAGLTTFKDIFDRDQGNIVLQGKINDYILDILQEKLFNFALATITVTPPRSYLVFTYKNNNNNILLPITYINISLNVYKTVMNSLDIKAYKDEYIIDENEIGIPIYLRYTCSPITFKPNIIVEEDTLFKQYIDSTMVKGSTKKTVNVTTSFYYLCKIEGILPIPVEDIIGYTHHSDPTLNSEYSWFVTTAKAIVGIASIQIDGNMGPAYMHNNQVYAIKYLNEVVYEHISSEAVLYNNIYTSTYTDSCNVNKVTNFPLDILSITSSNTQYITPIPNPSICIRDEDTIPDSDGTITIKSFYIRAIIPIQANLIPFMNSNSCIPTVKISVTFISNSITLSVTNSIYVIRYMSTGQPLYEIPTKYTELLPKNHDNRSIAARYPIHLLYTNNFVRPIYIRFSSIATDLNNNMQIWYDVCPGNITYSIDVKSTQNGTANCSCDKGLATYGMQINYRALLHMPVYYYYYLFDSNTHSVKLIMSSRKVDFNNYMRQDSYIFTTMLDGDDVDCIGSYIRHPKYTKPTIEGTLSIITLEPTNVITALATTWFHTEGPNASNIQWTRYTDVSIATMRCKESSDSDCRKYCNYTVRNAFTIHGIKYTDMLYNLSQCSGKNNLYDRLFGKMNWIEAKVIRDGVLNDPFRKRYENPEYQLAAPVGVVSP